VTRSAGDVGADPFFDGDPVVQGPIRASAAADGSA